MHLWLVNPLLLLWLLFPQSGNGAYVQSRRCHRDDLTGHVPLQPDGLRVQVQEDGNQSVLTVDVSGAVETHLDCTQWVFPQDIGAELQLARFEQTTHYSTRVHNATCLQSNRGWQPGRLYYQLRLHEGVQPPLHPLETFGIAVTLMDATGSALGCLESAEMTKAMSPGLATAASLIPLAILGSTILAAGVGSARAGSLNTGAINTARHDYGHWHITRIVECITYIQFIFFSSALTVNYPRFVQPISGLNSWSVLLFSKGPVTSRSLYQGMKDGIYEVNGTFGGTSGLELMTQVRGAPVTWDTWGNIASLSLIILVSLWVFLYIGYTCVYKWGRIDLNHPNITNKNSGIDIKTLTWMTFRLFLSLLLLPLTAWTTYQFNVWGIAPTYYVALPGTFLGFVFLSFLWSVSMFKPSRMGYFVVDSVDNKLQSENSSKQQYGTLATFVLLVLRGTAIGGFQSRPVPQIVALIIFEVLQMVVFSCWMGVSLLKSRTGWITLAKLFTLLFSTTFIYVKDEIRTRTVLGYILLGIHASSLLGHFFIPSIYNIINSTLKICRENRERQLLKHEAGITMRAARSSPFAPRTDQPIELDQRQDFNPRNSSESPSVQRILNIFHLMAGGHAANFDDGLTLLEYLEFMHLVQGEDISSHKMAWSIQYEKLVSEVNACNRVFSGQPRNSDVLSAATLFKNLSSRHNSAIEPEPTRYTLDRPMNEYYISSSHNTYLMGRQIAGTSTVEGYVMALSQGCRCVEVDCWDGQDTQPIVTHGRSLTTAIDFKEVIATINQYAFVKSQFPLWISLEVHCSPPQQVKMVNIMKEIFGTKLVTEPLDPMPHVLPSPSQLMGRVLIKVKKPTVGDVVPVPLDTESSSADSTSSSNKSPASVSTQQSGKVKGNRSGKSKTITKALGELGVYCAGSRFAGFNSAAASEFNHIFSLTETSVSNMCRNLPERSALEKHNENYLMRVYPDAARVSSSNFNPLTSWHLGVQMVALNWQSFDDAMQLNRAMFAGHTDFSGYSLKPTFISNRGVQSAISPTKSSIFSVHVISITKAHNLLGFNSTMNPNYYVKLDFFDSASFHHTGKFSLKLHTGKTTPVSCIRSRIATARGSDLIIDERLEVPISNEDPGLTFIRFSVIPTNEGYSYSTPLATGTVKFDNLKPGFRTLELVGEKGQGLGSSIFFLTRCSNR